MAGITSFLHFEANSTGGNILNGTEGNLSHLLSGNNNPSLPGQADQNGIFSFLQSGQHIGLVAPNQLGNGVTADLDNLIPEGQTITGIEIVLSAVHLKIAPDQGDPPVFNDGIGTIQNPLNLNNISNASEFQFRLNKHESVVTAVFNQGLVQFGDLVTFNVGVPFGQQEPFLPPTVATDNINTVSNPYLVNSENNIGSSNVFSYRFFMGGPNNLLGLNPNNTDLPLSSFVNSLRLQIEYFNGFGVNDPGNILTARLGGAYNVDDQSSLFQGGAPALRFHYAAGDEDPGVVGGIGGRKIHVLGNKMHVLNGKVQVL